MQGPRVLVVGASMGAGHMAAARVLRRRLEARGARAEVVDLLRLAPWRQGELLRGFYRALVGRAPALYGAVMAQWMQHRRFFEQVTALGDGGYVRGLAEQVERVQPDVVVSTYNLAGQLLGRLRRDGRLATPAVSYVTDPGAHPYWVAAGVDLHLAPLAATAGGLRQLGADVVETVAPLVDRPARVDPAASRARWQLPPDAPVALVNGGSWGVGDAAATAAAVADEAVTVVLCGRSERLRRRVPDGPSCRGVGWTDDVSGLIAAADVVVDNAGGTTCWEALAAGRPVILHRPIPGHGRLNAETLAAAGLATVTEDTDELAQAVLHPSRPDARPVFAAADAADLVLACR